MSKLVYVRCPWCDEPLDFKEGHEGLQKHIIECLKREARVTKLKEEIPEWHPEVSDEEC